MSRRLLAVLFVLIAVVALRLWATSGILMGSMTTVNNTSSNSASVAAGTLTLPGGYLQLQHNGLAATNDVKCDWQFSTDNTNFTTAATFWPAATNSGTERFFLPSTAIQTVYYRVVITTTNSQQVFVNFTQ